jgi:hypothetical protein
MKTKLNIDNVTPGILSRGSIKGEDTVIKHIFDCIGTTNKFCVEFGTEGHDGQHCSTTNNLKYNMGWTGIMFDMQLDLPDVNLHREFFTKENICERFKYWNIPKQFDFLSVDVDGNDFYLLSSILKEFTPRVIAVEVSMRFNPEDRWMLKYNPNFAYFQTNKGKGWYGTSPKIMKELGEKHGYSVVKILYDNMFLIKNEDLHPDDVNPPWEKIYPKATPEIYDSHNDPVKNEEIWMNLRDGPLPE